MQPDCEADSDSGLAPSQQAVAAGQDAQNSNKFSVSHRSVLAIALPMTFAYLSVPLIGLVDTAVIGQLGVPALIGGIAIGGLLLDILFVTFNFLRAGTTGLTAQAMGSGDRIEIMAALCRGLALAVLCGLVVILLQRPLIAAGLWAMDLKPAVGGPARAYLEIRIWAAPFALASFVQIGWLLGLARAGFVLGIQFIFAAVNVVLSLVLVLGYGWGVTGVAVASVVAEVVQFALSFAVVWFVAPDRLRSGLARIGDRAAIVRIIAVNRDIMIRSFTLLFTFAFFTREGARLGEIILAANAILMQFFLFGGFFLDGLATASEQVVGRAIGARYRPAFARGIRLTLLWGCATACVLSALYLIAGAHLIAFMTTSLPVREVAGQYLIWAALTPIVGAVAFVMDGIYIGATWSRDMRNMMLLSALAALVVWAVAVPALGNHGLWLAIFVFLGARGITLSLRLPRRQAAEFATG